MHAAPDPHLAALHRSLASDERFAFVRALANAFPAAQVYLVGGIVRDALLGRTGKDYDFVVRGVPADALHAFLGERGDVALVGRNFGVYKFRPHGLPEDMEDFDIALPRREHAAGTGGYRDVEVQTDPNLPIDDDVGRRDFTVNAMALDMATGDCMDPFHGRDDLAARIIRAVRDPNERFGEDRSRMLRGLRFATQLGFDIEPETMRAIRELMPNINETRTTRGDDGAERTEFITPRETIAKEFIKGFVADPVRALDLWDDAGAIRALMPELLAMKDCAQPDAYHTEGDVWTHTRLALGVLRSSAYRAEFGDTPPSALVALGVLFHDIGKPPTQKTPERDGTDRIRFDGHDRAGGTMTRAIANRLALAAPFEKHAPDGTRHPLHVDVEELCWIIDHHLLLLEDPAVMRNATIERYFFNAQRPGDALLRVTFCDGSASIPAGATAADLAHFRSLQQRITELRALVEERDRLPKAAINGNDIIQRFALPPGPRIGELIEILREEQLTRLRRGEAMTGEDAYAFLDPIVKNI